MKGKPLSPRSKTRPSAKPKWKGSLTIVVIDERPIRDAAFKAYQKVEKQVAKASEQIEAFETRDVPAFYRWEAHTFGPLMSQIRDIGGLLEEKNHLLALIDEEVFWTRCTRVVAYRRVMEARNNPSPSPAGPEPDADFEGSKFQDDSIPKVFGDSHLPPGFDIDKYDSLSRKQKKEVYEYYEDAAMLFEMIYGIAAPQFDDLLELERERSHGRTTEEPPPYEHHIPPVHSAEPPPPPGRDWDRIKELYRILVRRLHPDMGGSGTARERDLWQQVQDAYKARDLEWLEAIHGRLEAVHHNGVSLSIQLLRRMTEDLASALFGLRSQLAKHRRHPAWRFHEKTAALAKFETKRRRELETELAIKRDELDDVEAVLNDLAERAAKPAKKKSKGNGGPKAEQGFFEF